MNQDGEPRYDEDEIERFAQQMMDRARNRRPQSPSTRTPNMSWHFNHADQVDRQLQADGHRTWGFVIYRTTYDSDEDWTEFLRRLQTHVEEDMDFYNGRDILERHALTVFDNRSIFDGASTSTIREHFRQWADSASRVEQQQSNASGDDVRMDTSPRYRFCIQVDTAALNSVIHPAPPPSDLDASERGWVKLINKAWTPRSENPIFRNRPDPNEYEAIEGNTDSDVGWMKCPYQDVMTGYYVKLVNRNGWTLNYRRPPVVAGWPYKE